MRALTLLWLMPAFAFAQDDPASQWEQPPQAPQPAPLPGPPPAVPTGPAPPATPTAPAAPQGQVQAPEPTRFTPGHVGVILMGAVGTSSYFGVRVEAGAVLGWPRRMEGTTDRARGLTLGLAADLLAGKIYVDSCMTAGVCGSRYQGGLALRAAYNWGVIGNDGIVAPVHSVFAQAVPFLSSNSVPSAPLAPGALWGEHGVRLDVGLTSGFIRGSTWPRPGTYVLGGGVYFALSLEWLAINGDESGRFRFGISGGVGL